MGIASQRKKRKDTYEERYNIQCMSFVSIDNAFPRFPVSPVSPVSPEPGLRVPPYFNVFPPCSSLFRLVPPFPS